MNVDPRFLAKIIVETVMRLSLRYMVFKPERIEKCTRAVNDNEP
jgi:hypothetical protein